MARPVFLILGCGFTGRRVAQRLLRRGHRVIATTRSGQVAIPGAEARRLDIPAAPELGLVPPNVRVLHSIPVIETSAGPADPTPQLLAALGDKPSRIVYLSTTSVYGEHEEVDERTPVAPETTRSRLRISAEQAVESGPWSNLVLRPAAIYGPGRGVHVRLARGEWRIPGDGSDYVSRIHVDDLAAIAEAALLRDDVTGAYPVADDEPCTSLEITRFSAEVLALPMPEVHGPRRSDRRVDGRAIRRLLDIHLQYPSYKSGIPASIRAAAPSSRLS
jgi:nucleoside-diphosphate-sugar epimerase